MGRILADLKQRGQLGEPERRAISAKRKVKRSYALRKPKEYHAADPGDLVEIDTLDIGPIPSMMLKQFTARDIVSRWDVLEVLTTASAKTAREFLSALEKQMSFPVKAIQVDGGSEFFAEFVDACKYTPLCPSSQKPQTERTCGESKQNPYKGVLWSISYELHRKRP